jgi:hypothetical protein
MSFQSNHPHFYFAENCIVNLLPTSSQNLVAVGWFDNAAADITGAIETIFGLPHFRGRRSMNCSRVSQESYVSPAYCDRRV